MYHAPAYSQWQPFSQSNGTTPQSAQELLHSHDEFQNSNQPRTERARITDELKARLSQLQETDSISVIVTFAAQLDLSAFPIQRSSAGPMIRSLQALSKRSEQTLKDLLADEILKPKVRFFWINNTAALRATPKLVMKLANSPAIVQIDYDMPVRMTEEDTPLAAVSEPNPVWNISKIKVDSVWIRYGINGTGIVLGSMDTGIDTSHPALRGKWRGGNNSWIDIINGRSAPYDDHGHGTATIGVMVGGDGPGPLTTDIGVAYGAKVISAKVLDSTNSFSTASIVIAGAQWMLDPDGNPATNDFPHVINNSWYFFARGYTGFYSTVQAWRTVGIIPVFSIGNYGPGSGTTRSPADYNNCIGVGGTNINDGRYTYTSEGPSPVGSSFPPDLRKPDISAPGEGVVTSTLGGGYGLWSGTSFASPHVAATAGLMLQANAALDYDQILSILDSTAVDLGAPGYDYIFGYGRINALTAIGRVITSLENTRSEIPQRFSLSQNYPNPFNPNTTIRFAVSISAFVSLKVHNLLGQEVSILINEEKSPGDYTVTWNASGIASGVYFYRMQAGDLVETKKLILLR